MFKTFEEKAVAQAEEDKTKKKQLPKKPTEETVIPDAEPDLDVEIPDYFNFIGTKIILVCGTRQSGRTRFASSLLNKLLEQGCEADFTLSQEKAVKYVDGLQSIDELKQALCDNVIESIDAPRFLIIDGPPVFHPDELNCIALALVER